MRRLYDAALALAGGAITAQAASTIFPNFGPSLPTALFLATAAGIFVGGHHRHQGVEATQLRQEQLLERLVILQTESPGALAREIQALSESLVALQTAHQQAMQQWGDTLLNRVSGRESDLLEAVRSLVEHDRQATATALRSMEMGLSGLAAGYERATRHLEQALSEQHRSQREWAASLAEHIAVSADQRQAAFAQEVAVSLHKGEEERHTLLSGMERLLDRIQLLEAEHRANAEALRDARQAIADLLERTRAGTEAEMALLKGLEEFARGTSGK